MNLNSFWDGFKWLAECPGREEGKKKVLGVVLYICCLVASICLVLATFQGSQSANVSYSSEGGGSDAAVIHRVPDFIACPKELLKETTVHNVALNPEPFRAAGIGHEEIDYFAEIHRRSCENEKCDLSPFETPCDGTKFERFCHNLENHFQKDAFYTKFTVENYERERNSKGYRKADLILTLDLMAALHFEKEKNDGKWTLKMLWMGLIYPGYGLAENIISSRIHFKRYRVGLNCYFYKISDKGHLTDDGYAMEIQQNITQTVWIGKSLCMAYLGSKLRRSRTPFFGCKAFNLDRRSFSSVSSSMEPYRYWIGNLALSPVNEPSFYLSYFGKLFNNNTKQAKTMSGVVHYNMIVSNDSTSRTTDCLEQSQVRGMRIPCKETGENHENWYYELSPQSRLLRTVWVYGKTKISVLRENTFTSYTRFQFGSGVFGCLLGMSVAQIIETFLLISKRCIRNHKGTIAVNAFRIVLYAILILGSLALTVFDMESYVRGRFSTVFNERSSDLEIPEAKFCPDNAVEFAFLNITKMAELNVSLQLYGYLKYAGMLRTPITSLISKSKILENGTLIKEVPEWMVKNYKPLTKPKAVCNGDPLTCGNLQRPTFLDHYIPSKVYHPRLYDKSNEFFIEMDEEARNLERKLGLAPNSPVQNIINALHLEPKRLITKCRVQNQEILDCWKHIKYTYHGQKRVCLTIDIPRSVIHRKFDFGYENGLFITVDHFPYYRHSDRTGYHGPNAPYFDESFKNEGYGELGEPFERHRRDATCSSSGAIKISDESLSQGFQQEKCTGGGGWSFIVQSKSFSTSEIEYRFRQQFSPISFAAEVRTGFKFNDLRSNCDKAKKESTCTHPNEELSSVIRSLYYELKCSCSICYGTDDQATEKMLTAVRTILGRNSHCCKDTELFRCLSDEMERVDWKYLKSRYYSTLKDGESTLMTKEMTKELKNNPEYMRVRGFLFANPSLSLKNQLYSADHLKIQKLFPSYIFSQFTNSSLQKLINYARSCYKEPCKVESLELLNIQPRPVRDHTSDIAIFYSTDIAYGMEVIDTLDPVQLMATLLAGYSATFGISLIGLIELVVIMVGKLRNSSESVTSSGRRHVLKSLNLFLSQKLSPTEVHPSDQKDELPAKSMNSDKVDPGIVAGTNEMSSKADALEIAESSSTTDPVEIHWRNSVSKFLVGMLMIFALASSFFIVYFFATFSNAIFDGGVTRVQYYEPPSIVLCVEQKKYVRQAIEALTHSSCTTRMKSYGCHELFTTFFRNREGRFCFMLDNSRKLLLADETQDDLVMSVPENFPPVFIGAFSLNQTSLKRIYPYTEWKDENFVISYDITLRESQDTGCVSDIANISCKPCPTEPELIENPSICCLSGAHETCWYQQTSNQQTSNQQTSKPATSKPATSKYDFDSREISFFNSNIHR